MLGLRAAAGGAEAGEASWAQAPGPGAWAAGEGWPEAPTSCSGVLCVPDTGPGPKLPCLVSSALTPHTERCQPRAGPCDPGGQAAGHTALPVASHCAWG